MQKTLGGDRIGSGKKMKVELHGYERSSHDMGYLWRSTMAAGTLVPFLSEVALPGDTFDIDLNCDIKTHPTVGPLFGSYKIQLDVFQCPVRLYQAQLHNNKLGIGMQMANVKLPQIELTATAIESTGDIVDLDNSQINPSSILSYLGIRGVGTRILPAATTTRQFNAIPFLAYWDIYKNYYANKQEEIGAVIHTPPVPIVETVDQVVLKRTAFAAQVPVEQEPSENDTPAELGHTGIILLDLGVTPPFPILDQIMVNTTDDRRFSIEQLKLGEPAINAAGDMLTIKYNHALYGDLAIISWGYIKPTEMRIYSPVVRTFPLDDIDKMKDAILQNTPITSPFIVNTADLEPYKYVLGSTTGQNHMLGTQEGLGLKTYQSDLFNNWLQTEWIDGTNGITEVTAIDTTGGSFTLDTLNLSKKVYDMLNRIAVSGGSYNDWLDAVYTHNRFTVAESPIYLGGLIKELIFQEVVSNSQAGGDQNEPNQPLGTLAGKGVMAQKHKGGQVIAKVDEPSYIIGLISLTPRIDYSQGNKWDTHLLTMDDFHKPALDEIGFQELITEQMAWWTTEKVGDNWITKSAGKQPAWMNYMTNVNQTRGNFAIAQNEMFMTLNRRYNWLGTQILDLTTYIDPAKFNHIFAQTALDAQNFWAQISVDITARRKMSAKIMPNL